jgi:hypothetical protein
VIRNISTVFQSPTKVEDINLGGTPVVDVMLTRTGQSFCFVKGWFEHTMPLKKLALKHQPISILRLDGDLYSSTKVVLDALFSSVSDGGYIIVDDYALEGCKQAVHDFFDEIDWTPKRLCRIQGEFPVYFKKE